MRLTNPIGWDRNWLRQVVEFCCDEVKFTTYRLKAATFSACRNFAFCGSACLPARSISVKIHPLNAYPLTSQVLKAVPAVTYADSVEVLVHVTAHEIAFLKAGTRPVFETHPVGLRDFIKKRDAALLAGEALNAFRRRRAELMQAWGDAGPGPIAAHFVYRLSCGTCGSRWEKTTRPSSATRRTCPKCFPSWKVAAAANQFLTYERVPYAAHAQERKLLAADVPTFSTAGCVAGGEESVLEAPKEGNQ